METMFVALITSYDDGSVESIPHLFSTFEKAMEFLHKEYLDIKAENLENYEDTIYDIDETKNHNDNQTEWFHLETYNDGYWCRGEIYGLDVN